METIFWLKRNFITFFSLSINNNYKKTQHSKHANYAKVLVLSFQIIKSQNTKNIFKISLGPLINGGGGEVSFLLIDVSHKKQQ